MNKMSKVKNESASNFAFSCMENKPFLEAE